jgi:hypothetical protein
MPHLVPEAHLSPNGSAGYLQLEPIDAFHIDCCAWWTFDGVYSTISLMEACTTSLTGPFIILEGSTLFPYRTTKEDSIDIDVLQFGLGLRL